MLNIASVLGRQNEHLNYAASGKTSWWEEKVMVAQDKAFTAKLDYWRKLNAIQVITEMEDVRQCGKETKQVEGQRGKGLICAPHIA